MMPADYNEVARELNELRNDLTRHSHAAKFAAGANKAAIEDLKRRIEAMDAMLRGLKEREAADAVRLQNLEETRKEHTGRIETLRVNEARDLAGSQRSAAKWGLYGAIAVAVISGVASLALQLMKASVGGG